MIDVATSLKRFRWNLNDENLGGLRNHLKRYALAPHNVNSTCNVFNAIWMHTPEKKRAKATRLIWDMLDLFDRDVAVKKLTRVLYKRSDSPVRKLAPAYSRFKNIFRLWACEPSKVEVLRKKHQRSFR